MRTGAAAAALAVLTGLLVAGCGGTSSMNDDTHVSETKQAAMDKLHSSPSLEDTEQHMHDTVQRIADTLTSVTPGLRWRRQGERSQGPCGGGYTNTGGLDVLLPHMVSDSPIPDSDWPRALQAVRNVAREAGITEIEVFKDQPGEHDVSLTGGNGNAIHFGSAQATVIDGQTGCRLPASEKRQPG